ncbi:MAG: hypothetical protein RIQ56_872 [Candidatus Parcubacteria bacterium]|jgi:hypothetical protein
MHAELQKHAHKRISILTVEHPYETIAFRVFCATLFLLVCAYLYFVSASVLNVIARKDAMRQSLELTAKIGSLEQRYFNLSDSTTKEIAEELGLSPIAQTAYVFRPGNVGANYTKQAAADLAL